MPATATAAPKIEPGARDTKKVPAHAFCLPVHKFSMDAGEQREPLDAVPVTLRALSGKPVKHWYWDKIVLDLDGMTVHKSEIAIDYCHDDKDIVGYLDSFESETELVCRGELTPFHEKDRASEIIHKSGKKVPYEASILWEEEVIEWIAPGVTSTVNGQQVEGPLYVAREWSLRGVAICPHGVDRDTVTAFSRSAGEREVHVFSNSPGEKPMPEETTPTEPTQAEPEAVETPTESQDETQPAEATGESKPDGTNAFAGMPGEKFLTAFGEERGGMYFARGMSFEEATAVHCKWQQDQIETLRSQQPKPSEGKTQFSVSGDGAKPSSPFRLRK